VINLGRSIMGSKGADIMKAATLINRKKPYTPIIVDLHPQSSEKIRIRGSFDSREPLRTYQQLLDTQEN